MKIKHLPWILSIGAIVLFSGYGMMYPTGAPEAKTGSPGDGANCTECHGGTATTTNGLITSNIPGTGYVPGTTYQITATNPLTGTGKMGFEVSPQNVAGTQLGTLISGAGSQLVGGTKYVTHTNANATTSTWTFGWVAPAAGTGAVTFYGAFARRNPGPVTKSTLTVQEALALPAGAGPITGPGTACKNDSVSYSVGTIAGATAYVWTAPSGATIASGQGTVSVSISFGASAVSGNVSVYGTNTAGNGAPSNKAVTVNSAPVIAMAPDGPSMVNLQNTTTCSYSTSSPADSYVWQLIPAAAGTISGTTAMCMVSWNSSFIGNAEITVKGLNTCGEGAWSPAKIVQVLNTTGILENASDILVNSNQSAGYITLTLNTGVNQAHVQVFDLSGRIVLTTAISGSGTQQLDRQLNAGVYIIAVEAGSSRLKKKILVM
ncbi:MAG: T9SS type A sorting domain-containing protein [Bacteroidota bacterium]